jgi:hypothetical protein
LYQYINDGGNDICDAMHVKFISLPLLMNNSGFPSILAFETVNKGKNHLNYSVE